MTPAEGRALRAGAQHLGVQLDGETTQRIDGFLSLLAVWNRRIRLTSERETAAVIEKHVVDSLALLPYLPARGMLVDIGSGAGFPGIIVACAQPGRDVVLLEPRRRRASFLGEAIRTLGLTAARVLEARAEDAASVEQLGGRADVVTARGLRLDAALELMTLLLAPGGIAIAMQTPRTAAAVATLAEREGLQVCAEHPYRLARGEKRLLVVLQRRVPIS